VNEHFAQHYWPNSDALGKFIHLDSASGPLVQIVGIAPTVKYANTFAPPMDLVHVPLAQNPTARMALMVRSSGDPLQLVQPVRDVVRSLDANMPMLHTMTYEDYYLNKAVKGPGIAIDLVGSMGATGLVLAIAGLYGVVAYNVSRRTREIGIRIALGAAESDVLRLVLGKGLTLVAIGTGLGVLMGFGVERMINSMLFNGGGVDAVAYAIVVPSLFLITALAAYMPARKASQIAPTQALRCE
jgi:ABC-type antimicrobial peptide transport system permease subunit